MTISSLPARYLDKHELAELAEKLAESPELWSGQVAYSGGRRHYASIHRDEYVDIWLICWSPGNDTGWHDHDVWWWARSWSQTHVSGACMSRRSSPKAARSASGRTISTV